MDNSPEHITNSDWDAFDRYWLRKTSPAERAEFEERLESDPVLRAKFEDYRNIVLAVEESGLRSKLPEYHHGTEFEGGGRVISLFRRTGIHWAAAALLVALAIPLWLQLQGSSSQRLFESYFRPDPGLPTMMGTNDNYSFYEAMVDYKQGAYTTAISKWERLRAEQPTNDTLTYFLGVASLAGKNTDDAIAYLTELENRPVLPFPDETYYYLGMSFLKKGNNERAIEYLEKSNAPEAREVLKKIR